MSAAAFFQMLLEANARMTRRRIGALREQSRLMMVVIIGFVLCYWVAGYLMFKMGFGYLGQVPGLSVLLVDRMLYLFFAFLFLMLVFSNLIIGYSSMFKSHETQWMLTLPVRAVDVFRWKFAETTVLASWAFVFLSAPLMLAYGQARNVEWTFYVKVLLLFIPFTVIPAAIGAAVILLLTRYLHRQLFKWVLFLFGAAVTGAVLVFLKPVEMAQVQHTQMAAVMNQLLSNSRFTLMPLLPSYWLTTSLISWGEGWGGNGALYFMVLASNAMMATVVCVGIGERFFYEGWSRVHSQGGLRIGVALLDRQVGVPRTGWIERAIYLLPRIHPATRALVMKDIRVFWRDTSQWSQFVIFFGLLGLYVLNLRNVAYDTSSDFFARFVSVMNLGACSMTLGTLTTRFVFPQFSLEGKRLWIVGMVPYGLKRVLLQKFWLSSVTSIVITVSLMLISSVMLRLPAWLMLLFCATMVLMSFALCGIAVGLGALFPNFGTGSTANRRDDNPARIVSGFGGTFCFVLSLVYIAIVIAAEAWPMYMQYAGGDGTMRVPIAMVAAWLFVSFLSLAAASIPMQLALRRVESLEM